MSIDQYPGYPGYDGWVIISDGAVFVISKFIMVNGATCDQCLGTAGLYVIAEHLTGANGSVTCHECLTRRRQDGESGDRFYLPTN